MPTEWEYADDADFADENEDTLREILPTCKELLKAWDLFVNDNKTDITRFTLPIKTM